MPIGAEDKFRGVIDLIKMEAIYYLDDLGTKSEASPIPDDLMPEAQRLHHEMVEKVVESDDALMEKYLEGEEVTPDELIHALRVATIAGDIVPVLCGSALKNKGVQRLLDAVVNYLPSPKEVPPKIGINPYTDKEVTVFADERDPFVALVFKIVTDPFVGRLAYMRVYSGTVDSGTMVENTTRRKKERIGRLLQMHANQREELKTVYAGDIAAVVGLKNTFTGETLADSSRPVVVESINS
jgi:elongation factor G